jgi:hypothetical protein
VDAIVERLIADEIDVMIVDPLGAMHTLPENDNTAANALMGALREIAQRANVAIVLVHHTSKGAGKDIGAAGAAASRGASAIVDAARVVRQLDSLAPTEAKLLGTNPESCRQYVRIDNGKANLAPAAGATWVRLVGVPLGNGTLDYPKGDNVQTVERWTLPTVAQRGAVSDAEAARVQAAIQQAAPDERRQFSTSLGWIGYLIAEALDLHLGAHTKPKSGRSGFEEQDRQKVGDVIRQGTESNWFVIADEQIEDRKKHPCIAIGTPVADVAKDDA